MMMETCAGLARDTATRAAANKIKSYLWEWLKRVVSVVSSQVCTNIHCMHAMLEDGRGPICFFVCGKLVRDPATHALSRPVWCAFFEFQLGLCDVNCLWFMNTAVTIRGRYQELGLEHARE